MQQCQVTEQNSSFITKGDFKTSKNKKTRNNSATETEKSNKTFQNNENEKLPSKCRVYKEEELTH